jgi:hypothetical protein
MNAPLRFVVAPVVVALLVLAVVLGVMRLADPPGDGVAGSDPGSDAGTGVGAGGGSPGNPGSTEAPPTSGPTSQPDPDAPMSRFTSVTRTADDLSVSVRFWGGVRDCYRYTVDATEDTDVVTLTLREKRTTDKPCIELAQEYDRTVPLEKPLGLRRVVDEKTGETLLGPTR